ncbi:hypothetical protein HK101_011597 [Irineochytrium annulatum]|nr:hypothetical protein HK101_011597 [Irineochytrium annulatum]
MANVTDGSSLMTILANVTNLNYTDVLSEWEEELIEAGCLPQRGPSFDPNSDSYHLIVGCWAATIVFSLLATVLSVYLAYKHFQNYFRPNHQRLIVRILLMVPIYAVCSCLSFRFYWTSIYFDIVRDCYEAFVIFSFYCLLEQYVGETFEQRHAFMQTIHAPPRVTCVFPFNCLTFNPRGKAFLVYTRVLILQYVIIRPAMTILALILESVDRLCPSSMNPKYGEFWVTSFNFVSVTVAMYALIIFYIVIHHEIDEHKPLWKFIAVKFVVFFSFWQSIVLSLLDSLGALKGNDYWTPDNLADLIQSFLICLEMAVAAFIHIRAFSHTEFAQPATEDASTGRRTRMRTRVWPAMMDALSPSDILKDIKDAPMEMERYRKSRKLKKQQRKLTEFGAEFFEEDDDDVGSIISMVSVDADGRRTRSNSFSLTPGGPSMAFGPGSLVGPGVTVALASGSSAAGSGPGGGRGVMPRSHSTQYLGTPQRSGYSSFDALNQPERLDPSGFVSAGAVRQGSGGKQSGMKPSPTA